MALPHRELPFGEGDCMTLVLVSNLPNVMFSSVMMGTGLESIQLAFLSCLSGVGVEVLER